MFRLAALGIILLSACTPNTGRVYYPSPVVTHASTPTVPVIPDAGETAAQEETRDPLLPVIPTSTPTSSLPTLTPSLIFTPIPSSTPYPTPTTGPTDTPHPTGSLPVWGTWALMPTRDGLWAMRPDGSTVAKLTNDPIYHFRLSPNMNMAAYVTHPNPYNQGFENPFGYVLKIITLPKGEVYEIARLDMQGLTPASSMDDLERAYQAISVYNAGGMDWSPNGYYLAFSSAHEGPVADVYIYTPSAGQITRISNDTLPNGPAHAYFLDWSPDSSRIFYARAYSFGTGDGYWMAGAWVGRTNGTSVQVADDRYAGERLIDWPRNETLLLSSWMSDCGNQNLRTVNARTGEAQVIWPHCFDEYQYDRQRGEILLSIPEDMAAFQEGNRPGLFQYWTWQTTSKQISEKGFERLYRGDVTAAWFGYNSGDGLYAIHRSGQIEPLFTGPPYDGATNLSIRPFMRVPGSKAWLWSGDGFYISEPGQAPQLILPFQPESFTAVPGQNGLYYLTTVEGTGTKLYAIRAGEWIPMEINEQVHPDSISWLNP